MVDRCTEYNANVTKILLAYATDEIDLENAAMRQQMLEQEQLYPECVDKESNPCAGYDLMANAALAAFSGKNIAAGDAFWRLAQAEAAQHEGCAVAGEGGWVARTRQRAEIPTSSKEEGEVVEKPSAGKLDANDVAVIAKSRDLNPAELADAVNRDQLDSYLQSHLPTIGSLIEADKRPLYQMVLLRLWKVASFGQEDIIQKGLMGAIKSEIDAVQAAKKISN